MSPQADPLDMLLTEFRRHLERRDRSLHSIRAYLSDVRQFAAWFTEQTGEPFALSAVTEYDVQGWRDDLEARAKPATVNRKLAALSALYDWAGETGQVTGDPTQHVSGVDQQPMAPQALSDQALRRILRQPQLQGHTRDAALLELLAATGLRAAEVAGLKIADLELGERGGWVTVRGKGRKQRRVPVHAPARRALRAYLTKRGDVPPMSPLFITQQQTPLTPYAVWYTVKKYARLAGIDHVKPHSFRHTVATRLVRDPEVDLVTAAAFLGHSRLDTTARYSQPSEQDLARAAARLEP